MWRLHTCTGRSRRISAMYPVIYDSQNDNYYLNLLTRVSKWIRFDSKRIVSGAYDGKIKVWDLQAALDPRAPAGTLCLRTLVVLLIQILNLDDFLKHFTCYLYRNIPVECFDSSLMSSRS